MKQGLAKIKADHRDRSFLHTFGALAFDVATLPPNFSIYDGRPIPNQDAPDARFTPELPPLPYGCTGESQSFLGGLEDSALYNPEYTYMQTPPGTPGTGRDMRASLQSTIDAGFQNPVGTIGYKRTAYFNVYAAGAIDDFDAIRIAIWINQAEKRAVTAGTYWYPEFETIGADGILPVPSFNTAVATMHDHIYTGWKTINGVLYLEDISWQGMGYGANGLDYQTREIVNALMNQPYTGTFTITKVQGQQVVTVGMQVYIDQLTAFIRNLFGI